MSDSTTAILMAGIPASSYSLYHRIRFIVGDPTALIAVPGESGMETTLILRDIEMARARQHARVDRVHCPADFAPKGGLSGDRETATAQSVAEFLARAGITTITSDRTLPFIYAHILAEQGIDVKCDLQLGVRERRAKDDQEVAWLAEAQATTEQLMRRTLEWIASADVDATGQLIVGGELLTSERVQTQIDIWVLEAGCDHPGSIVAGGPQAADCHHHGSGPLRTGEPVIVDIFPRVKATRYNGDCTRTVVHGQISERVQRMHTAVQAAKKAAIDATREGVTGESVHDATSAAMHEHGFPMGLPSEDDPDTHCAMTHGTGHGVGLEVHEPPLLDRGGPELVVGDCLTIEPGLYSRAIGGVRLEDMVIVRENGCDNLNCLPETLDWKT
ncbi:MAG TPA: aminopeptidase P family protein [Planctomycetes bacterium]|nr:aminopeptidase P family protein [Planctomycetota bacterium]